MKSQTVYISVRQVFYIGLKLFFTMQKYSIPAYEVKLPYYIGYRHKMRLLTCFSGNIKAIRRKGYKCISGSYLQIILWENKETISKPLIMAEPISVPRNKVH